MIYTGCSSLLQLLYDVDEGEFTVWCLLFHGNCRFWGDVWRGVVSDFTNAEKGFQCSCDSRQYSGCYRLGSSATCLTAAFHKNRDDPSRLVGRPFLHFTE
jgi:hypothetical protein